MTAQAESTPKRRKRWKERDLGVRVPSSGTTAAIDYFGSFRQINSFLQFLLYMAGHIEHSAEHAHKTLLKITDDPGEKAKLLKEWEARRSPIEDLKVHRQFLMEVTLVRHVENYLNYLSSLLREIFLARPEVLRSSDKIELETVLRHDSIEDLVRTVAERKVESLSYTSFTDLADYFHERFHITLVPDSERPTVIDAVETRNISVHNRCIINSRFVSRTGGGADHVGKLKGLWIQDIEKIARFLAESVKRVDTEARKRLRVRGHHFPKTKQSDVQQRAPADPPRPAGSAGG